MSCWPETPAPTSWRVVGDLEKRSIEDVVAATRGQLVARLGVGGDLGEVAEPDERFAPEEVRRNGRDEGLLERRVPALRRERGAVDVDAELLRDPLARAPKTSIRMRAGSSLTGLGSRTSETDAEVASAAAGVRSPHPRALGRREPQGTTGPAGAADHVLPHGGH